MMKKKLILSFFFVALGFGVVKAQDLPDKKETLKTVTKVNDYFMKKYADYRTPSFVKNVTRPSNIWTRGVYYEGLMALYSVYPRDDYYKYAVDWSNYHEWGFRNGTTTRNADDYCASQTYIDLYNICPDPERIRKVKANIDMLVNTPQVNDWWWIDAIQMGMPVFAKLGKLTGEQKYFDKMWDMYEYTRNKHGENGMYNQKEGLWWRDSAMKNDKLALEIFEFTGNILGEAFADFVAFSSPEAIILFGGLTKAGDLIMNPIKRSKEKNMLKVFEGKTKLLFSQLKESDAAVLGASALGWEVK